jgi:hypothetical protein
MQLVQLVAIIFLIATGLYVALVADVDDDLRLFGWLLVGMGVLGLVLRFWLARMRERR